MPRLAGFTRNRCTCVEQIDDETLRASCRLQDTLTDASVVITVGLPELEIRSAEGRFRRTPDARCSEPDKALQQVVGVRIGAGMLKIIEGLIADITPCPELAFMVEECCHGVILSFTKDTLRPCPEDAEGQYRFFRDMVLKNTRLYNRCAAFAPGSSLVEGITPP